MRRREFITLIGGAAAWPLAAHAQQGAMPRIGILVVGSSNFFLRVFRQGLHDLGYVEGQNLTVEVRSGGGNLDPLPGLAQELIRLRPDVIVASQTPAVQAVKLATNDIPIVMAAAGDPVGTGLVASLSRPGGNVTGISAATAELAGKCLELIKELLPAAKRAAVLANATDPFTKSLLDQVGLASRVIGISVRALPVYNASEFGTAFAEMERERVDAVIVQPSLLHKPAAELASRHHLPALAPTRGFVEAGGLMSYSGRTADVYRDAAGYVDKILKGSKPADLPVQQPSKFELIINLKTARALGLTVPLPLLARADEVIE
jgi:putative tryptophan/tyrosine transport system substrate-binding protein